MLHFRFETAHFISTCIAHLKKHPMAPFDQTVIYHLDPNQIIGTSLLARLTDWLDPTERARMQRFVHAKHRHAFLISHALVRKSLGDCLQIHPKMVKFAFAERGKPSLAHAELDQGLAFNLTHTEGFAAIAISVSAVGIDAECLTRNLDGLDIANRYFTPRERKDIFAVRPAEQQQRFLTYWTLKEAYLKAEGWGIVDSLDGFEFQLEREPSTEHVSRVSLNIVDPLVAPSCLWYFQHMQPTQAHLLSIAVATKNPSVQPVITCRAWQPEDWSEGVGVNPNT